MYPNTRPLSLRSVQQARRGKIMEARYEVASHYRFHRARCSARLRATTTTTTAATPRRAGQGYRPADLLGLSFAQPLHPNRLHARGLEDGDRDDAQCRRAADAGA